MFKKFILILLITPNLFGLVSLVEHDNKLSLSTIYGTINIEEPVLIDLIKSPAFNRLQDIRQYGILCHARSEPEYTRYQHSLGVFFITRKYGAPLAEQIAALLHDISHTVFSHVGDRFFKTNYLMGGKSSYQDTIHEWYLEQTGITAILKKYGLEKACSNDAKKHQYCFDQCLPDLCADRIEYNLTGGLIDNLISIPEIAIMLKHLHFENDKWFFDDINSAQKFGLISIRLSESRWGSGWSSFIDHSAAQALQRAYELGIITLNEIHFSTDDIIWQKLVTSHDNQIAQHIYRIKNYQQCLATATPQTSDVHLQAKFSGTDPLVSTHHGLQRLSLIDHEYQQEFERVKNLISRGWHLRILPIN